MHKLSIHRPRPARAPCICSCRLQRSPRARRDHRRYANSSGAPDHEYALQHGATVVLASHLGRPKGKPTPELSLKPIAERLSVLLKRPVAFGEDSVGPPAERAVTEASGGWPCSRISDFTPKKKNDSAFAAALASLADVYVNDAFGAAHRAHASVEAITHHFKQAAAGLLMEKEISYFGRALQSPRPSVCRDSWRRQGDLINSTSSRSLLGRVDRLLIGGAMAYTFLKSRGVPSATRSWKTISWRLHRRFRTRAANRGVALALPGHRPPRRRQGRGKRLERAAGRRKTPLSAIAWVWTSGRQRVEPYAALLKDARTVVWNGPMGVFEIPQFAKGTTGVARAVAAVNGTTIVGGGDSIAAVTQAGVADRITQVFRPEAVPHWSFSQVRNCPAWKP